MFSKGSLHLGTYAGIPLKVHWTSSFIFVLVFGLAARKGSSTEEILFVSSLVFVSFFCVVLHEYGHAVMAKRFHVRTIDIILSPIGGLARLERLPSRPIHEFFIAIAGPLVNLVIAFVLVLVLLFTSHPVSLDLDSSVTNLSNWYAYLALVVYINLLLCVFNLIPAFPMDGGRILRSLLSMKLGNKRSTEIASWIGYAIAVVFIIRGFMISYYILSLIGVFVMFMARGEKISAKHEDFLIRNDSGLKGLMTHFKFTPETLMHELLALYHDGRARNFMIFNEEEGLVGVVTEPAIKACLENKYVKGPALEYTEPNFKIIDNMDLQSTLRYMNEQKVRFVVVRLEEGTFGMLERQQIIAKMQEK